MEYMITGIVVFGVGLVTVGKLGEDFRAGAREDWMPTLFQNGRCWVAAFA